MIAWMIWLTFAAAAGWASGSRRSDLHSLSDSLAAWTLDPSAESLHVAFEAMPGRAERRWLAALRRAGAAVGWSSDSLVPIALAVEPANDPAGGVRVMIAAPATARVAVSDALGLLDTVVMSGATAEVSALAVRGELRASLGTLPARAAAADSLESRAVVVLGRAGWEAKFVIAALEERGWRVATRLAVAPGVDVRQGTARLDTAHTGVVVALDTTAAREARDIERFVRDGGGLVLAGGAARSRAFSRLAVGHAGRRVRAAVIAFAAGSPRRSLGFFPIENRAPGSVPLEWRNDELAAAARRVGAGRVVQVGYDATWHWRLEGGSGSPQAHREWWSAVVGSAGYRAARALAVDSGNFDPAPVAATFSVLGDRTAPAPPTPSPRVADALRRWMLALLFAALLAEWASRRLRGAP